MDMFLSLDLGTTAVKVALFDASGGMIALSTQEYTLHTPAQDIVELDPTVYWDACKKGLADVLARSEVPPERIRSIAACSQGETLIALDRNGQPLRNAIVWMDNRSGKEADEIARRFEAQTVRAVTGQVETIPCWTATKILWLARNEPEVFRKAAKYLLVEDYIIYRLTGRFVGEYSLYTSSLMLDIINKRWWGEMLDFIGIAPDVLVDLHESGEVIGEVRREVCWELGLATGTLVVTGTMDQTAAMIAAGNVRPGVVSETTGAALAICATIDVPPAENSGAIAVQYHAIPDSYVLLGSCTTGGMTLRWFRDAFFTAEADACAAEGADCYDMMTALAEKIPPGSEGLMFLPYLAGAGTPQVNADARGMFQGIGLHHQRAHFVRAIMEAVGFVLRQNIEAMERLGVGCTEIRSLGGGARSPLWNRIKADIAARRVITMQCPEAAALGAAILQSVAVGAQEGLDQALRSMSRAGSRIEPRPAGVRAYGPVYQKFVSLSTSSAVAL